MARRKLKVLKKPLPKKKTKAKRYEKHDYSPKDRERAMVLLFKHGHYSTVHKITGIAVATLRGWMKAMAKDEHEEIRTAIREEVIKGAWRGIFHSLQNTQNAIEAYKLPKKPTVEQIAKIAETSERVSRVLKNIGVIQEKLHITGDLDVGRSVIELHFHNDKKEKK